VARKEASTGRKRATREFPEFNGKTVDDVERNICRQLAALTSSARINVVGGDILVNIP
jgi:hypothetical protein